MKLRLSSCCWCGTLRSGCIIIGVYMIVASIMNLLFSLPTGLDYRRDFPVELDETTAYFLGKYGLFVTSMYAIGAAAVGVLDLYAIYMNVPCMLGVAVIMMVVFSLFIFCIVCWVAVLGSCPLLINYLITLGISIYFCLVLTSYYFDLREAEVRGGTRTIQSEEGVLS